jgi:imidazolonepropionase-like amidohydrolase
MIRWARAVTAMRMRRGWLAAAALAWACAPRPAPAPVTLLIADVTVVDVAAGAAVPHRTVVVAGRRIVDVRAARPSDLQAEGRIDGRGKFLLPGFWDMHAHLDRAALPLLLGYGITGVRDMGSDPDSLLRWRRDLAGGALAGPRLVFAGPALAGPPNASSPGRWIVATPAEGRRAVDSLAALGVDFVKVWEGLSRDAFLAVVAEARAHGLRVVGHVSASISPAEAADAGQTGIEHLEWVPDRCLVLFDPSATPDRVPPECRPAAMDSLLRHLAARGVWLDPTISMFRHYVQPPAWTGITAGFRGLTPAIRAAGLPLLAGTDTDDGNIPSGASLHEEIALLAASGFTPAEVLRAATLNPARFLGMADSLGTVERGRVADLVLLQADPLADVSATARIGAVVRAGRLLTADSLAALRKP